MLHILNDPAGITGRKCFTWNFALTMQENIALHLDGGGDCEMRINGIVVDPLKDARLDLPPSALDLVTVTRRPGTGYEEAYYIIVALLVVSAYTAAAHRSLPGTQTAKESPNNSLTAQTNLARTYQAVPDVYGYKRVWPDLLQPSLVQYINQIKYVTEWMCISRGKGTITDVQYAETPIDEVDGASFDVFEPDSSPSAYPEQNATTLTDVVESFSAPDVNGQELPYAIAGGTTTVQLSMAGYISTTIGSHGFSITVTNGSGLAPLKDAVGTSVSMSDAVLIFDDTCTLNSYSVAGFDATFNFVASTHLFSSTQTDLSDHFYIAVTGYTPPTSTTVGPFTLPIADAHAFSWNTIMPRGLKGTVEIEIQWWRVDDDGDEIPGTRESILDWSREDDTFDARYYSDTVYPAAGIGQYKVQFTRTNAANSDGSDVAKLENLFALRMYDTKVIPGVTVIRITNKATLEATGFSDRKYNLRWLRHVRTLTDDTLSESRNFARAMAHLWTISGQDIAQLDTDALAAVNTHLGETSPLLRFDGSLDDADMSLGERLRQMAYHARCILWRDGFKWTVTRDQSRDYPDLQLDYRNLAASGESAISYAAHLPTSNDGVELEYVNEDTQAKKDYVRLDISTGTPVSGTSQNPLKIKLPACTTLAQAKNRAQIEALRLLYQRTTVSDTALADGGALGIGSLVRWIDPNDFAGDDGLQGGEVLSIDVPSLFITTSEALDFKGETSGRILFTGVDGKHLNSGAPVVCTPATGGITLASIPTGLFVRDSTRQLGSRYAFGVGLTDAEIEASGLYVVTQLRPGADRTVGVVLAQYDDRMYYGDVEHVVEASVDVTSIDLAADSDGVVDDGELPVVITASVLVDSADDTANWTWSASTSSGLTTSHSGPAFTLTAMSSSVDSGAIVISGSRAGFDNVILNVPVTKTKESGAVPSLALSSLALASPHTNTAHAGVLFDTDGTTQKRNVSSTWIAGTSWYDPTTTDIGDSYWIQFTYVDGDIPSGIGGLSGSTVQMNTPLVVALDVTNGGKTCHVSFSIASDSGMTSIVTTGSIFLYASSED